MRTSQFCRDRHLYVERELLSRGDLYWRRCQHTVSDMGLSATFARAVSSGHRLLRVGLLLLAAQVLSLNALAECVINGPASGCAGTTNTYSAIPGITNANPAYSWLITNDTTGAVFLGDTNSSSVQIL